MGDRVLGKKLVRTVRGHKVVVQAWREDDDNDRFVMADFSIGQVFAGSPCGPKQNDWAIGLELPGVQVTRPPWVFAIGPVIGTFDWTPRYPNKCSGET